ncbi:MAG: bifunctional [glutamine synthetase] adenylyltransferase/[glutamine synthetase]-adenylyl-L-tyrosine phosphorylase [Propionibacteriales bacterium]|nr:bifunctional [glutamine synthetase] adenylyltransferase/[glutamine synthetase]-adenylyl-L-tyrosine phosphorylase [Propionibacteriales bacterium]
MYQRLATSRGHLARLGFADVDAAVDLIGRLGEEPDALVESAAFSADPDQSLRSLVELLEANDRPDVLHRALRNNMALRERVNAVLGASTAFGSFLRRHQRVWRDLEPFDLDADEVPLGPAPETRDQLRVAYYRRLLGIAARDLMGVLSVDEVGERLATLAGETLRSALSIAATELPEQAGQCRLAVIAMGKCGGYELNYVSDVDVIFVAEPAAGTDEAVAMRAAGQLASAMMRICSDHTPEGTIWQVDAALRPEGAAGPLVRTVASHIAYYERWAKTWEFQALLKARPVAGDEKLGEEYVAAIRPTVWQAADREHFVEDVQAMRRRVVDHIRAGEAERQIKLGPGGLRDVEFAVQLLQLVHGRADESLRSGNTLRALDALTRGGYVGREDGAALAEAYRFLRGLEHRVQLRQLRRTHVVPEGTAELRALGRSLGYRSDPVRTLTREWSRHAQEVRRLHEKIFYRPLLAAVARLPGEEVRLTPDAARQRLTALGYAHPASALKHLESLTAGLSRRAAIQRTLLPVMLGWFAAAPDPDQGLLAFRQVSDALGETPWYLRQLRDEGAAAERMARVLSSSRYASDLLMRAPEAAGMLADDAELRSRTREQLVAEMSTSARRHDDPEAAVAAVRAVRRRELFRCAVADLLDLLDVHEVGDALTDVAVATLEGALVAATRAVEAKLGGELPTRMALIAMGRLGGHEMSYGSDADVMVVHRPLAGSDEPEAANAAKAVVNEMQRLLGAPAADPPLLLDLALRPEGKSGPLVRTLESYASYYSRWAATWEAQALLRAVPVCGDEELQREFVELIAPLRWPDGGPSDEQVREVRRIKARVDAERLPRGADPATHTKLGPGGLADIEWTAQLVQMRHAAAVPGLRTTRTVAALQAAVGEGLLGRDDASRLVEAWELASRIRGAVMLVRGRSSDSLPSDVRDRAGVAYLCGYGADGAGRLFDAYRRATRRARTVVDRVFWG